MIWRNLTSFCTLVTGILAIGIHATGILALGSAQAATERRLALVIGNSNYQVSPLTNPGNDATLMADALADAGFEVTHMSDVDYRTFQRAVVQFGRALKAAGEDTVGMVYYAGHAVQAEGENYLIPVDADIQDTLDLRIQTLDATTLMASLENAGNRMNMVVLDACRNNPFKGSTRSGSRGLAKIEAPNGTLLAYSTAPGEVATDGSGRNSPYTAAFVKAMRTPGLPVEQVMKQVRIEVMERTGEQQVPWESSSLTGDFYFIAPQINVEITAEPSPTPAPADDNAAELEFWRSIAVGNDPALFQQYLDTYPEGLFTGIAQQRITALQTAQQSSQAKAAWEAVKDSDDPAMLQTVIDRYPGSVYAELAQVKMQSVAQQQTAAAADSAPQSTAVNSNRSDDDRLFWSSIKDSTNKSDYQAYLDQFPDGKFAAIARTRAVDGYAPQVASLSPQNSQAPLDGRWQVTWKVVPSTASRPNISFCAYDEVGTKTIDVNGGAFRESVESNKSRMGVIEGKLEAGSTVALIARGLHDMAWRDPRLKGRFKIENGRISGILKATLWPHCDADITMVRVTQ